MRQADKNCQILKRYQQLQLTKNQRLYKMSLFGCCKQIQTTGTGYQVYTREKNQIKSFKFYKNISQIKEEQLKSLNVSILQLTQSEFEKVAKQYGKKDKKWTDFSFPPNDQSLGQLNNFSSNKWKRISQIIPNPVIFSESQTFHNPQSNQYPQQSFLACISALQEQPERLKNIFGNQQFNPNGFYRLNLRVKSQVFEILIDDYVPVDDNGSPLFMKPHQNQIGYMLIEKARAKISGSYDQLFSIKLQTRQIFEQICLAPSKKFKVFTGPNYKEIDKFWREISEDIFHKRAIIVKTSNNSEIDWNKLNLVPNNFYSLIDCVSLRSLDNKEERILKLRKSIRSAQENHSGNQLDIAFWNNIQQTQKKKIFLSNYHQGAFNLRFHDFLCYFSQLTVSYSGKQSTFLSEDLFFNLKNGITHQLEIFNQGFYTFSVQQQLQRHDDGWARTSLLLFKQYTSKTSKDFEFVDGTLNIDEPTALLKGFLQPGNYVLYVKVHPTLQKGYFPKNSHLIVCGDRNFKLTTTPHKKHSDLFQKAFLLHATNNQRQKFNDDLMWMSWKLFNQGGYGYIAFGNDKDSKEKFIVNFNEEDLTSQGFKLKKPFKGKGSNQIIEVNPGQQTIIIVTIGNSINKNRKFPPKFGVNIVPFVKENLQEPFKNSESKEEIHIQ